MRPHSLFTCPWFFQIHLNGLRIAALVTLCATLPALCAAQDNDGFPKKTGVPEPGVQHPMTELTPDAEFSVSGHPDWLGVTGDAVWVASSNVNHVVRLDAKSNKPDIVVTVQTPC